MRGVNQLFSEGSLENQRRSVSEQYFEKLKAQFCRAESALQDW